MCNYSSFYYKSPIGTLEIRGNQKGIASVLFVRSMIEEATDIPSELQDCVMQLDAYFSGERKIFDLKLNPKGTPFQQKVWHELLTIPYAQTRTYLEQTKALGDVKAIRAVASANGKNPISIIIPCHRVIGSNGSLTGYAGGIMKKKWLLEHEAGIKQERLF